MKRDLTDLCLGFQPEDIEDITRWREDLKFMFEWQEIYLTSKCSVLVKLHFTIGSRA